MAKKYLTAQEASARLKVTAATLYAYVSRGLIRSEAVSESKRVRRYLAEDVQKLLERKEHRSDPAKTAHAALHWGTPVLDSALTLITENGLYYRGYGVEFLVGARSFEQVAALLWTGDFDRWQDSEPPVFPPDGLRAGRFLANMQIALALSAEGDWGASAARNPIAVGGRILKVLTRAVAFPALPTGQIADHVGAAWGVSPAAINAALILCADHELNASSFAARIVASTGASLYAAVASGLAALSGGNHGGHTARVAAMFREIDTAHDHDGRSALIGERLARGDGLPGFGHPLYPEGDPRARCLLAYLEGNHASKRLTDDLTTLALLQRHIPDAPTIDCALVIFERALNLPLGAAFALFALGRAAGWIAHALEQAATGTMIRPRATYTGVPPQEG
ncbi:MAG TPA: citrate synthase family protein [Aggregatilineales bacterium]|nr:excisionase [Anaerolineales bacterium]HRE48840.1 citrate synthase family protein [Aggregatilineales bacterium]